MTAASSIDVRREIQDRLLVFKQGPLAPAASALFNTLGYKSSRTLKLSANTASGFQQEYDHEGKLDPERARLKEWNSVHLLFQVGDSDLSAGSQTTLAFDSSTTVDGKIIQSYLFAAIDLREADYTRTALAEITRQVNRLFAMPVMILFRHGATVTLSVIDRRLHRRDESRDVLEKVTLIKDVRCEQPHRAHVEILFDLSLPELDRKYSVCSFVTLHEAWRKALDSSALNKRFYDELANWYFWAQQHVQFPAPAGVDAASHTATSLIRLITRVIFTWFHKEKGLAPEELFRWDRIEELLHNTSPNEGTYYRAILQNLFFGTLNTEMDSAKQPRKFRGKAKGRDQNFMIHNVYRYETYFCDPAAALVLFSTIPFLNGGLFECLDHEGDVDGKRTMVRIDGFSDRHDNPVLVPNFLFHADEQEVNLNPVYGSTGKNYRVRGLLDLLHSYKFTVAENTPIEEEVALDPELLGRVFENLLASYNPETQATARKMTGSFYTPREVVNYMVDEALIAYLEGKLPAAEGAEERLRDLLAYSDEEHGFSSEEVERLIQAIDEVKILDPACGSGAFPMGILHKLVYILGRLDPHNKRWKERQIEAASHIPDTDVREKSMLEIDETFAFNELDYGRKLYLIENCIFGVDIQPIAVQIAKLRFFISLVIDQRTEAARPNLGIRPLPNLETRFVAANALLAAPARALVGLFQAARVKKTEALRRVRERHFAARTAETKRQCRDQDQRLRQEISALLQDDGLPRHSAEKLAQWDPYDQSKHADFFDPEWMFGVTNGFDVAIGNPPYVRADAGGENLKLRSAILKTGYYETLREKWDLFVPFIERSYKLLNPGGVLTMIVSDAFCHAKYAQKPQDWFLQHSLVIRLDFLRDVKVFDAAVRNMVFLFQNLDGAENAPERRLHVETFGNVLTLPTARQKDLDHRAFFPGDGVAPEFAGQTVPLSKICYLSVGMVVNAHESLAHGQFELKDLVSTEQDKRHPKPFVEGKHLDRWLTPSHMWLEWGTPRAPALFRRRTFPELYDLPEKMMIARTRRMDTCIDRKQLACNHTVIVCVRWRLLVGVDNHSIRRTAKYGKLNGDGSTREEMEVISDRFPLAFLLGVMNSNPVRKRLQATRRSNTDIYPDDWKTLPIPDVDGERQAPIIQLVDQILRVKESNPHADITDLERQIDDHVARLYGLTTGDWPASEELSNERASASFPAAISSEG